MRKNTGTYWSAYEMKKLKWLISLGHTIEYVASHLERSEGSVRSRLYYLRVASLANHTDNDATIHTIKQEEKEDAKSKKNYDTTQDNKPNVSKGRVCIH